MRLWEISVGGKSKSIGKLGMEPGKGRYRVSNAITASFFFCFNYTIYAFFLFAETLQFPYLKGGWAIDDAL